MKVTVLFFGVLSEVAGTTMKIYRDIKNLDSLAIMINDDFPEMIHYEFSFSVNSEIVRENADLKDGDEVALLPPFAGG